MTLDQACEIVRRARLRAEELGVPLSIAVVDSAGHLIAAQRMDGAGFATPEIAWAKAWTAAAFGTSSGAMAERLSAAPAFAGAVSTLTHGRFMPRQGALPIPGGGAVGASGGTSEQDEEAVRAGIEGATAET